LNFEFEYYTYREGGIPDRETKNDIISVYKKQGGSFAILLVPQLFFGFILLLCISYISKVWLCRFGRVTPSCQSKLERPFLLPWRVMSHQRTRKGKTKNQGFTKGGALQAWPRGLAWVLGTPFPST
jgi:hypothetical protein